MTRQSADLSPHHLSLSLVCECFEKAFIFAKAEKQVLHVGYSLPNPLKVLHFKLLFDDSIMNFKTSTFVSQVLIYFYIRGKSQTLDRKTLINLEEQNLPTLTLQSRSETLLAYQRSDGWVHNLLARIETSWRQNPDEAGRVLASLRLKQFKLK